MLGDCDKTGRSNLEPRWPLFKKGQAVTHGEKQVTGLHERDFPSSFFFFFPFPRAVSHRRRKRGKIAAGCLAKEVHKRTDKKEKK